MNDVIHFQSEAESVISTITGFHDPTRFFSEANFKETDVNIKNILVKKKSELLYVLFQPYLS